MKFVSTFFLIMYNFFVINIEVHFGIFVKQLKAILQGVDFMIDCERYTFSESGDMGEKNYKNN